MTNTLRRLAAVVAVPAALTFALTACGGESGSSRPTTDELAKPMTSGKIADDMGVSGLPKKVITCIAQKFHDSDLSDDALRAIVNDDEDFDGKSGDEDALDKIQSDVTSCASAAK